MLVQRLKRMIGTDDLDAGQPIQIPEKPPSGPATPGIPSTKDDDMPTTSIADAVQIKGFIGACLVDGDSGLMLASEGGGRLDLNMVAALNTDFVKAKQQAIDQLGLNQEIEDILITLDKQIHLIRPLERQRSIFIYVALDKASANLGMARMQLKNLEANLRF
ncbi:roadblock/LC7 domain-containing protein [Rubellimicrobium roseum]|nr:roadblock/LC7 domain-containing protein [Rubellimicrobium roseum]